MERALDNRLITLESLDQELLATVPGDEALAVERMARRKALVGELVAGNPTVEFLAELQARTTRLEEKFLHWRRSSIMELSEIDQHLRYLGEQRSGRAFQTHSLLNVTG